jgi:TRAP-type mannitol/chloroaromatic compound transport system permease small subunit
MRALLALSSAIDWLNTRIGHLVYWLGLLMILIGAYNALARYLGEYIGANLSSNAYLESQWYLFGIMFMLGAAYTLKRDDHVRVDVVYGRLGPRGKAIIDLIGSLAILVPFCIISFVLSLDWVAFSWEIQETSSNPGGLPRYPIKTVIPVAFALLCLQGISQAIKAAAVLTGHIQIHTGSGHEQGGSAL